MLWVGIGATAIWTAHGFWLRALLLFIVRRRHRPRRPLLPAFRIASAPSPSEAQSELPA